MLPSPSIHFRSIAVPVVRQESARSGSASAASNPSLTNGPSPTLWSSPPPTSFDCTQKHLVSLVLYDEVTGCSHELWICIYWLDYLAIVSLLTVVLICCVEYRLNNFLKKSHHMFLIATIQNSSLVDLCVIHSQFAPNQSKPEIIST